MAKIRNAKPKNSSGGYKRILGNDLLANIVQKTQSAVISSGTELERIIEDKVSNVIDDLDSFIDECNNKSVTSGIYLCSKKTVKKSKYSLKGDEPDFLLFCVDTSKDICFVIELKDGHVFDTKKAEAEKQNLDNFVNHIAPKIPFLAKGYICCFNQLDKEEIVGGMKNKFSIDEVMTGKEFCDILGIDYKSIVKNRQLDTEDNFEYFIEEVVKLVEIQNKVESNKRKHIVKKEFYSKNKLK